MCNLYHSGLGSPCDAGVKVHVQEFTSLSLNAVIIPRLAEVAEANNSCRNHTKKQDIALSLVDAYRNISECCILHVP